MFFVTRPFRWYHAVTLTVTFDDVKVKFVAEWGPQFPEFACCVLNLILHAFIGIILCCLSFTLHCHTCEPLMGGHIFQLKQAIFSSPVGFLDSPVETLIFPISSAERTNSQMYSLRHIQLPNKAVRAIYICMGEIFIIIQTLAGVYVERKKTIKC